MARDGLSVGVKLEANDGNKVGVRVRCQSISPSSTLKVGSNEGCFEGSKVGDSVDTADGASVGDTDGNDDGFRVGTLV